MSPTKPPPGELDLERAWGRLRADRSGYSFVGREDLIARIDPVRDRWFAHLRARLAAGYRPSRSRCFSVPKRGGSARRATLLGFADELVYHAIVAALHENIRAALSRPPSDPLVLARLGPDPRVQDRLGREREQDLRRTVRDRIGPGVRFVAFADFATFFDDIEIEGLISLALRTGASAEIVALLASCLRRWAEPRGKGIPQGSSASYALAELYLDPIVRQLRERGLDFYRRVDDFYFFCRSEAGARGAVETLRELARQRGLSLNPAKVSVLPAAWHRAEGSRGWLFLRELRRWSFRALTTRLGRPGTRIGVACLARWLTGRPWDMRGIFEYLCRDGPYFARRLGPHELDPITDWMAATEDDFMLYDLIHWLRAQVQLTDRLRSLCRSWSRDRGRSPWLRAQCRCWLRSEAAAGAGRS